MEAILEATYYGNTVLEWGWALAIIVGALVIGKTVYWIFQNVARKLTAKTQTKLDDIILDMIEEPIVVILTVLGFRLAVNTLALPDGVQTFVGHMMSAAITLSIAWLLARLSDSIIQEYLVPMTEKSENDLDDQLLPIFRKGVKLMIWVLGVIVALQNANQNVGAVLAGLGVGGLALAIAAQDTVANIFGSVTIFADRPFAIKDRIRIKGFDGVVRDIGLRSTRLETRDGPIVTIPNAIFTDSPVENVSIGPLGRRVVSDLGLTYDTSAAQMKKAMEILHEISGATEGVGDNINISFSSYGDSAMVIRYAYFVNPDANFRGVQSDVNMAILERFGAENLNFAYPTRTIYNLNGDA